MQIQRTALTNAPAGLPTTPLTPDSTARRSSPVFGLMKPFSVGLAAAGTAVATLFKPVQAQAQHGMPVTENMIYEACRALEKSVISTDELLLGGAAVLVTGAGIWGVRDIIKTITTRQHEKGLYRLITHLRQEYSDAQDASRQEKIFSFFNRIKNPDDLKRYAIRLCLDTPVLIRDHTKIYKYLENRLSAEAIKIFLDATFETVVSSSSLDQVHDFIKKYGFPYSDQNFDLFLKNAFGEQRKWERRGAYHSVYSADKKGNANFKKIVEIYHSFCSWQSRPQYQLDAFRRYMESIAVSGSVVYTARHQNLASLLKDVKILWVTLAQKQEHGKIIDGYIDACLDGVDVDARQIETDRWAKHKMFRLDRDLSESDKNDLLQLYPYCHSRKTRMRILNALRPYMKSLEDYFSIIDPHKNDRDSYESWKDYSDWLAGHLKDVFEKSPTLRQIHFLDAILAGKFTEDPNGATTEVQHEHLRAASRWALAHGGYANSVQDYLKLVDMDHPFLWNGGKDLTEGTSEPLPFLYCRHNNPIELAWQTINHFTKLNPTSDELASYVALFPIGISGLTVVRRLAELGALKTPGDYLKLTEPEFIFGNPDFFHSDPIQLDSRTQVLESNAEENLLLANLYFNFYQPAINDLKETDPAQYQKFRDAFLSHSMFLRAYVETRERWKSP